MPSNGGVKLTAGPLHINGDSLVTFDIRVAGDQPIGTDLIEVCFMPLNHSYRPHPTYPPFHMRIKPDFQVDLKIARISAVDFQEWNTAADANKVAEYFEMWWNQMRLKLSSRAILVGHNIVEKMPWIKYWLGGAYSEIISPEYRDIGTCMHFMNDKADFYGQTVPFKLQTVSQFAQATRSPLIEKNSLMANCKLFSDGYRWMLGQS